MTNISINERKVATQCLIALAVVLTLFVFVKFVEGVSRLNDGNKDTVATITVTGTADAFAVPDIATIDFTVRASDSTVALAQSKVTLSIDKVLAGLKAMKIDEKDIKTISYVSNPEYSGPNCSFYPCRYEENPKIIGYSLSEMIQIKVRDTANTGTVLELLGTSGVTEISGPNFTIDDEEAVKEIAREDAIANAKQKARTLAGDLDVRLVRIVSFSENGDAPYYYGYAKNESVSMDSVQSAAPSLPTGENKFTSTVSITYEIK